MLICFKFQNNFRKTPPYYYILYCSVFSWFKRVLHFECVEIGRASNLGVCVVYGVNYVSKFIPLCFANPRNFPTQFSNCKSRWSYFMV